MKADTAQWLASADEDWAAALLLRDSGLFAPAIFHLHLAVEKVLKSLVVEEFSLRSVPITHSLTRILELVVLDAPEWLLQNLAKLSPLAVEARYGTTLVDPLIEFSEELCKRTVLEADEARSWLRQRLT